MKKIFNFKSILALATFGLSSLAIAQETVAAEQVVADTPIYEKLGVSPTILFTIMLTFTIFLVIVLVNVSNSTSNVFKFKADKAKKAGLLVLFGLFSSSLFAGSADTGAESEYFMNFPDSAFWAFMILDIIIVMLILYLIGLMKGALSDYKLGGKEKSIFAKLNLTNAVEIEEEDTILMDHDYDGIHELDNDLPPWWKYGFYITIVWGAIYFFYFQVFEIGNLQQAEFAQEMLEGEEQVAAYKAANPNLVNAENVELLTDAASIKKGKEVYDGNCVACHAGNGGGGIGPNLTDNTWIYNGDIKGVFTTVSEGAENGMIAWKDMLSPDKIQAVASYVLSLEPAEGGKDPQGENIFE